MKISEVGDGKYTLRDYQVKALDFVDDCWKDGKPVAITAPVGSGKSAILRSIQRAKDGLILTPANSLVKQYQQSYPELNILWGKQNHRCNQYVKSPCSIVHAKDHKCRTRWAGKCSLDLSEERFLRGDATVTNVMMAWLRRDDNPFDTTLVDEAHVALSIARQLVRRKFKIGPREKELMKKLGLSINDLVKDQGFATFISALLEDTREKLSKKPTDDFLVFNEFSLDVTNSVLVREPEKFVRHIEKGHLYFYSVFLPKTLTQALLGKRTVVTSGTLFPTDLRELFQGQDYHQYEVPSVIPPDVRPVVYQPSDFSHSHGHMNYRALAENIAKAWELSGRINGICHVTYAAATELLPHLRDLGIRPFIFTESKDKMSMIAEYVAAAEKNPRGNLLVAPGCAEGLDLKGDLARINIITKLMYPNLGDEYVAKRKALDDGAEWYTAETLKTLLQQIGRSTRGPDDKSVTVVLDPSFLRLLQDANKFKLVSKSFSDSLVFSSKAAANKIKEYA